VPDENTNIKAEITQRDATGQAPKAFDYTNLVANLGTIGIVFWMVLTGMPAIRDAIDAMRVQMAADQVNLVKELAELKHNMAELRRDQWRNQRAGPPPDAKPPDAPK
jgi:hypothetical protein